MWYALPTLLCFLPALPVHAPTLHESRSMCDLCVVNRRVPFLTKRHSRATPLTPQPHSERVLALERNSVIDMTDELADDIRTLWAAESIQAAYKRRNEFQLNDSAK